MDINDLVKRIRETKSTKNNGERLSELAFLAEELANDFTECMSHIESEIEYVLERTSQKMKDELSYNSVEDVTRDINVRSMSEY